MQSMFNIKCFSHYCNMTLFRFQANGCEFIIWPCYSCSMQLLVTLNQQPVEYYDKLVTWTSFLTSFSNTHLYTYFFFGALGIWRGKFSYSYARNSCVRFPWFCPQFPCGIHGTLVLLLTKMDNIVLSIEKNSIFPSSVLCPQEAAELILLYLVNLWQGQ